MESRETSSRRPPGLEGKSSWILLSALFSIAVFLSSAPPRSSAASERDELLPRSPLPTPRLLGEMRRLPALRLRLGSTAEELLEIAASCNQKVGAQACSPLHFALERDEGKSTYIPSFFLDRTEISLRSYVRCVRAGRCRPPTLPPPPREATDPLALPVVGVSYSDATAYCAFQRKRLPSEDEFERAARGPHRRTYPWGFLFHAGRVNGGAWDLAQTNDADGFEGLAPVDAFLDGQTPEGILQLSGNAEEWTLSPESFERGHTQGMTGSRMVRGGHYASPPWLLRAARRIPLPEKSRLPTVGFRCAKSLTPARRASSPDRARESEPPTPAPPP